MHLNISQTQEATQIDRASLHSNKKHNIYKRLHIQEAYTSTRLTAPTVETAAAIVAYDGRVVVIVKERRNCNCRANYRQAWLVWLMAEYIGSRKCEECTPITDRSPKPQWPHKQDYFNCHVACMVWLELGNYL